MTYKISVIVCTYNRAKYIRTALESLEDQIFKKNLYEIVIINNNSTDKTELICKKFIKDFKNLNIEYFCEKKQGLSFARNKGISLSKGEIITFIDDDAIACENYLEILFNFFKKNINVKAIGGKIYPIYESKEPKWISKFLLPMFAALDMGNKIKKFPHNKFPIGANMSFRKEMFEKYGLFDTNLGRKANNLGGSEEKDFFYRLDRKKDLIFYLPEASVEHTISNNRLTENYIKKQAQGIGISESFRYKKNNKFLYFLGNEFIKWIASFVLFLWFLFCFQLSKATMILKFRYWVYTGIGKKYDDV